MQCKQCGIHFSPVKLERGTRRKFCSKECGAEANRERSRQRGRSGPHNQCLECNKDCMGVRCLSCHARRMQKLENERRSAAKWKGKHAFHCEHCGVLAHRQAGGYTAKHKLKNRWCSRTCQKAANALLKKGPFCRLHSCIDCGALIRQAVKRCSRCVKRRRFTVVKCLNCESAFLRERSAQRCCSAACKYERALLARRKGRKAYRQRYGRNWRSAARRHGVTYERIDRAKVFARDGWRCQICGRKTLKANGVRRLTEATLDHRIPISKGGDHTYANVQCACRSCNEAKGNKQPLGQMPLESKGWGD